MKMVWLEGRYRYFGIKESQMVVGVANRSRPCEPGPASVVRPSFRDRGKL